MDIWQQRVLGVLETFLPIEQKRNLMLKLQQSQLQLQFLLRLLFQLITVQNLHVLLQGKRPDEKKTLNIERVKINKERLEQEDSYQSNREAKVQGIISTYGEVGRAVGASKTAAAAAAAARQAALDKEHAERKDKLATSAMTRDERVAQIAAEAAAKGRCRGLAANPRVGGSHPRGARQCR